MKRKAIWVFALAVLAAFSLPACYLLTEKPMAKARHFQPFASKEYMAPCKYLQVEDVNLAYVEAGSGPDVILLHGGFLPFNEFANILRTPLSDPIVDSAVVIAALGAATGPSVAVMAVPLAYLIQPPRTQAYAHFGAVATIDTWKYNFDELAKHFHVIALDLPGFGNSDKPKSQYKIEDFTRYLNGFLDAKKIERASLAGLDIGSMIALDFVLAHPERVDKLILINSAGTAMSTYDLPSRAPLLNPFISLPVFRLWQNDKAARVNLWAPVYRKVLAKHAYRNMLSDRSNHARRNYIIKDEGHSKEFMDQVIDYKMKYAQSQEFTKEVHALHSTLVNLKRRDLRNKITAGTKTIQAPTLIIWGLQNPRPGMKEAVFLNRSISNSSLNVFTQSGHFPMVEESEAFNRDLIQFLSQPASAPAPKKEEVQPVNKKESKKGHKKEKPPEEMQEKQ